MSAMWYMSCGTYRHWAGSCPLTTRTEREASRERRAERIRIAVAAAQMWPASGGKR